MICLEDETSASLPVELVDETAPPSPEATDSDLEIDTEIDVVPFEYTPDHAPKPKRHWLAFLATSTAAAWMVSVAAHASMGAGAYFAWQWYRQYTPPAYQFGAGDSAPEVGLKDREGQADRNPGFEGIGPELPAVAAVPAAAHLPATSDTADDLQPQASLPTPPTPAIELTPAEPAEPALLAMSPTAIATLPAVAPTERRTFAEASPVAAPPATQPTTDAPAVASGTTGTPATETANASPGTPEQASTAASTATSAVASSQSGGDRTEAGQGGASTGAGGTADTGMPGIRAGLREGQRLIRPAYPVTSRRNGEEGTVRLNVEVLADGRVGQIEILTDAGYPRLAKAAIDSLTGQMLRPALLDGHAVRDVITIPFVFRIRE